MLGKLGTPNEYYGVYRISAVIPQIDVLIQTSWNTVFIKPKNTGGETTFQVYASNGVETSTYANDIISNEGGFVEIHSPYAQKIDFAISAGEHGRLSEFKTLTLSKTYVPAIRAASYDAIGHGKPNRAGTICDERPSQAIPVWLGGTVNGSTIKRVVPKFLPCQVKASGSQIRISPKPRLSHW